MLGKNKSDIKIWAELDYTNEENYKFIKNYLSSHKLYSKNKNAETPSEGSDEKSCEKEILTVYKKIKRIPETAKKVVVTNSDLVFKNIDSIYKVRNIISRWKELLKMSKRITDRNSLHKNGSKFYGCCKRFVNYFVSNMYSINNLKVMVNGYLKYSEEYIEERNSKYADSIEDVDTLPVADTNTMYQLPKFPEYDTKRLMFKYQPKVIAQYYFGIKPFHSTSNCFKNTESVGMLVNV